MALLKALQKGEASSGQAQSLERKLSAKEANKQQVEVPVSEFIPYACHYDGHTLLTKNGELLQTVKIVGFTAESVDKTHISLRDAVRKSLFSAFGSNEFAVWFHTIRRKKSLDPGGDYPVGFARYVNRRWQEQHDWSNKFINELYITVVREGQAMDIRQPQQFVQALLPALEYRRRDEFLQKAHGELEQAVSNMLQTLELYGARRLGLSEKRGVTYSEPLRFLAKIINLIEQPVPLPMEDLSTYLPQRKISFGYNALEVRGEGEQHYGAVLTIKDYRELTTRTLDKFLQLPQEFIVSQCVDFIHADEVKREYEHQKELIELSEDQDLARLTGLTEILNSDRGSPIDYGEQQLSVLLLEEDLDELDTAVERAMESLRELGIVAMREDIRLEECFWSLLPGNFAFISRLKPINTLRVGGFASLHNFPAGRAIGNYWGAATTIFYTAAGTPYFFSFHSHQEQRMGCGHTMLIGPYGSGKTAMVNFLCSEAQKYHGRLLYLDKDAGSEIFIRALGGEYQRPMQAMKTGALTLNPLGWYLRHAPEKLVFWMEALVTGGQALLDAQTRQLLQKALDGFVQAAEAAGQAMTLSGLAQWLEQQGQKGVADRLRPWCMYGQYGWAFDHAEDAWTLDALVCGVEMGDWMQEPALLQPMMLYLMDRVQAMLDGTPTIVVMDEAWHLLDHPMLAHRVAGWLEMLERENALAILATESVEHAEQSRISATILQQVATRIYLPNPKAGEAYMQIFGLSEREYRLVRRIRKDLRHFLLKHDQDAVIAQLDLSGMDDILCVLASTVDDRSVFRRILQEYGERPEDWLPVYQLQCARQREQKAQGRQHANG